MSFCICALDDDESILYTLEAMAQTQKWYFKGTTDADACLEWIREGVVELLLLDYHMPGENGLDVLRKVKALVPSLPVLILTVEQDPATAEELLLAGAEDFINKPVRLADFLSRIRLHRKLREHARDVRGEVHKGIAAEKLQKLVAFLKSRKDAVEIEEVVESCGLSYTTAHRYLDHLVKSGLVVSSEAQQYGKPGRPARSYRFTGVAERGARALGKPPGRRQ